MIVGEVLWYIIPVSFAYLLCENSLACCIICTSKIFQKEENDIQERGQREAPKARTVVRAHRAWHSRVKCQKSEIKENSMVYVELSTSTVHMLPHIPPLTRRSPLSNPTSGSS